MTQESERRFGAELHDKGTRFALWAPTDSKVDLKLGDKLLPMPDLGDGWRECVVDGVGRDARYAFVIDGTTEVPDPASRFQPDGIFAPSQVIDHRAYAWHDHAWKGRPWSEAVIWEAHVGTATPQGTYRALIERLPHLRDTGITAIELMPLADCPGSRNWGYDGVLPYAPKATYGSPDDLKALIDAAHGAGIMMLLDVVYNHFGPSGNYLHSYAAGFFTERHQTPWGAGINFDGRGSDIVRAFFVENALMWLRDYHFDGLRFDAAHAMLDDSEQHFLSSVSTALAAGVPDRHVHLILENEHNESRWLERSTENTPKDYTAQWNDDFHHCWHVLMTGESEGYYEGFTRDTLGKLERSLAEGFVFQGEAVASGRTRGEPSAHLTPAAFIAFLQNHDQVGNRAFGERLSVLTDARKLDLARTVLLLCPQIPMLFMGEEWGSRTPFCFFVDFAEDEALSNAVRDGRRREFAAFKAFAHGESTSSIPDPTALSTFESSRLDWADLSNPEHQRILSHTRELLGLRAQHVATLLETTWVGADIRSRVPLDIAWRFSGGVLRLRLNVTDVPQSARLDASEAVIHASAGATVRASNVELAAWSCLFTVEAA